MAWIRDPWWGRSFRLRFIWLRFTHQDQEVKLLFPQVITGIFNDRFFGLLTVRPSFAIASTVYYIWQISPNFELHENCDTMTDYGSRNVTTPVVCSDYVCLTHWGRMTHICVGNLTIIGSDNGLSPGWRQAIIWTNDVISWIRPLGTNFSEMIIEFPTFWFTKMHLNVSSAKWRPLCLGLDVLTLSIASPPSCVKKNVINSV